MGRSTATEPTSETILAEFPKNSREVVRIRRTEYQGRELIDIRTFYPDLVEDTMRPGKGLALRLEQLPDLIQALETSAAALDAER
jgi:hypothetical protein